MKWESFKSILLVVLIVLSLGLTRTFMLESTSGIDSRASKIIEVPSVNIELSEIIHPQGLYINFGGDSHTAFFFDSKNIWKKIYTVVSESFSERTAVVVDKTFWNKVKQERSIRGVFNNAISVNDYFQLNLSKDICFDEVIIPLLRRDFILIKDKNKYYKLSIVSNLNFEDDVTKIEASNYVEYKTIEKRFSISKILKENNIDADKNFTIIPISDVTGIPFYKSEYLLKFYSKELLESFVKKIFGDDLSFIKNMTTYDDTEIYMSNYGKKILSFAADGSVEYINNLGNGKHEHKKNVFLDDLKLAWGFLKYFEKDDNDLYLSHYEKVGETSYFYFNSLIDNQTIYYSGLQNGEAIEIHIKNNIVNYYFSNIRDNFKVFNVDIFWDKAIKFSDIFNNNFDIISKNYQEDLNIKNIEDVKMYILQIVNAIESFDFEYFIDVTSKSNSVIPCWRVKIGSTTYHFDIYEGIPLKIIKEKIDGLEKN
ncbi:MAG: hypothetical protein J7L15_08500 [Clostridiales bacterium]|nr:hypothetical protein [Clostridiales bacterium]